MSKTSQRRRGALIAKMSTDLKEFRKALKVGPEGAMYDNPQVFWGQAIRRAAPRPGIPTTDAEAKKVFEESKNLFETLMDYFPVNELDLNGELDQDTTSLAMVNSNQGPMLMHIPITHLNENVSIVSLLELVLANTVAPGEWDFAPKGLSLGSIIWIMRSAGPGRPCFAMSVTPGGGKWLGYYLRGRWYDCENSGVLEYAIEMTRKLAFEKSEGKMIVELAENVWKKVEEANRVDRGEEGDLDGIRDSLILMLSSYRMTSTASLARTVGRMCEDLVMAKAALEALKVQVKDGNKEKLRAMKEAHETEAATLRQQIRTLLSKVGDLERSGSGAAKATTRGAGKSVDERLGEMFG